MSRILIIDDENDICFLISEILSDESFVCETANDSNQALNKYNNFKPDLIILDVWLGNSDLDGLELLQKFKNLDPLVPIIIISGHGNVDMAVKSIKFGAFDFIEKPFNSKKIVVTATRAIESASLLKENDKLKSLVIKNIPLVGNSNFILNLKKNIKKISQSNARVFISGPSGSGKNFIAEFIHQNSVFSKSLCNIIDIKSLSENELNLLFSNLETEINKNIFIQSNNNTLILDNINYLDINFQKKLLFFLENNNFFIKNKIILKLKIITLTSKNIQLEIKKGNFIQALYDRLNVVKIDIPSIDNRREDIMPIYKFYLNYYNKSQKYNYSFSSKVISKLELYDWPGNISQIINYAEKTIILNKNIDNKDAFEIDNLPIDMGDYEQNEQLLNNYELTLKDARNNFEKNYLISQIKRFNGNIKKISEFTGMERTALYRKFKTLNIQIDKN